jgi:hypothetical protein
VLPNLIYILCGLLFAIAVFGLANTILFPKDSRRHAWVRRLSYGMLVFLFALAAAHVWLSIM